MRFHFIHWPECVKSSPFRTGKEQVMDLVKSLKKVAYAGVGVAAAGVEKGQELLEKMAKKGESTVERNKGFHKQLKANVQKKFSSMEMMAKRVEKMSEEDLAELKKKIEAAEQNLKAKAEILLAANEACDAENKECGCKDDKAEASDCGCKDDKAEASDCDCETKEADCGCDKEA